MGLPKVAVAMSGGVDSTITAARLKEDGYEVLGFHMKLWPDPDYEANIAALSEICRSLGIPFHPLDFQTDFQTEVIAGFCREYRRGRTPNPCLACNRQFKFGRLLCRVRERGCNLLATGHYARIAPSSGGYRLLRAADRGKDQSYFLCALGQDELAHVIFPLGELLKSQVRQMAGGLGLSFEDTPESHDICFIPGGDYRALLDSPPTPGDIVDAEGNLRGRHRGLINYTVGQRQGLGISASERQYVIRLDVARNRLVIGDRERLLRRNLTASNASWVSGHPPEDRSGITACIRYRAPAAPADIEIRGKYLRVTFHKPQHAVSPGQTIAFYRGDEVLGGAIIETDGKTDTYG